jgi:hypothetical protein
LIAEAAEAKQATAPSPELTSLAIRLKTMFSASSQAAPRGAVAEEHGERTLAGGVRRYRAGSDPWPVNKREEDREDKSAARGIESREQAVFFDFHLVPWALHSAPDGRK